VIDSTTGDAATELGREAQILELKKVTKQSFNALLAVGILQLISGVVIYFVMRDAQGGLLAAAITGGVSVIFFGLAFWARSSPLPAAIVGLSVYGSLLLLDVIFDPTSLARGILLKFIIIAALVQAIRAGVKHKQLVGGTA
jgi:hypothetical protein